MAQEGDGQKFDHVVSVMFENRSFDNLLGHLYEPGEVASFEGVGGKDLSNPIPSYAPGAERGVVPLHVAPISTIASGFATFDHRFCEVPSQTFTNRSFYHAGSTSGLLVNAAARPGAPPAYDSFPKNNDAETIFERLDATGLSWRVYVNPGMAFSITGMIHTPPTP